MLIFWWLKMAIKLSKSDVEFIQKQVICRLATITAKKCVPMVRPVWHVFDGENIYFASDPGKPKLHHISLNPNVSVVFDDYDPADWSNLRGIRIQGVALALCGGGEYRRAHELLKGKYPEYRTEEGGWKEGDLPIVKIMPKSFRKWASGKWEKPHD
jgi:nitroimidazol reductase NimA-like FMN-containing flavoprotein (pyridoxamine 5'-phosphate oxidase superfamily)